MKDNLNLQMPVDSVFRKLLELTTQKTSGKTKDVWTDQKLYEFRQKLIY